MMEVGKKKEQVLTVAVPMIDFAELNQRWESKSTLLQQMIGDTNRPTPDQSYAAAESEVVEELKEE